MALGDIADSLVSQLPLACLVYDHRGFGASDTLPSSPRNEILPWLQISDLGDAITYASTLDRIDSSRIGLWGYSYAGGHVLQVSAYDRRVKAVISLGPCIDAFEQASRLVPLHAWAGLRDMFAADRAARLKGEKPILLPVVSADPMAPAGLPSRESYNFFSQWDPETKKGSTWKNEITLRTLEVLVSYNAMHALPRVAPTPVLIGVGIRDTNGAAEMTLRHYAQISEPKELCIVDADHYQLVNEGKPREELHKREIAFLKKTLCA